MDTTLKNALILNDVGTENVTLLDEFLKNAEKRDIDFLLGINPTGYEPRQVLDPYKFLAHFYTTAGLPRPATAIPYENSWERSKDNNFRGHMFGHYMSALAMANRATSDTEIKEQLSKKINICVIELKKCQDAFAEKYPERAGYIAPFGDIRLDEIDGLDGGLGLEGDEAVEGTVFVPWYNLHKVLAGLLDIIKHTDNVITKYLALDIAKKFGDYFYNVRASKYTAENKEKMLKTEYGGMNDAFYELYNLTGDQKYRSCAEMFDEISLFDELAKSNNILPGRHANTQIPKFIGALKRYTTLTQNKKYYNALTAEAQAELPKYLVAVKNFFDIVLANHSYITGGNSCDEHFHAPDTLAATIHRDATHETCNTHNMLKIARELFKLTQDKKYSDYYENAFINGILSAQNPKSGEMMYFHPMGAGYYKVFRHGLFWCCTGTGIESYVKLGDSIYFKQAERIYINLYFSSVLTYTERNLKLVQTADIVNSGSITIRVEAVSGEEVLENTDLYLRVPSWSSDDFSLNVEDASVVDGYIVIKNVAAGDKIELKFPLEIAVDALKDNSNVMAFRYGPVVLSAGLGDSNLDATKQNGIMVLVSQRDPNAPEVVRIINGQTTKQWQENISQHLVRVEDSETGDVQFKLIGTELDDIVIYSPHYKKYKERYGLYMTFIDPATEEATKKNMQAEKEALLEKEGASAYLSNFDNHAYEAEYNLQENNTSTHFWMGKTLRYGHAPDSWFSYDLPIVANTVNYLNSTLAKVDTDRSWAIYINDEFLDNQIISNEGVPEIEIFYTSTKEIPSQHLSGDGLRINEAGNPYITVKFASTGGWIGGIFGMSITQ